MLPGSPDKSELELLDDGAVDLVAEVLHSAPLRLQHHRVLVVRQLEHYSRYNHVTLGIAEKACFSAAQGKKMNYCTLN